MGGGAVTHRSSVSVAVCRGRVHTRSGARHETLERSYIGAQARLVCGMYSLVLRVLSPSRARRVVAHPETYRGTGYGVSLNVLPASQQNTMLRV